MGAGIILLIIGVVAITSGKTALRRGRGGKMTKDGLISSLFGYLCIMSGLMGLLGEGGVILFGIAAIAYWIGRDTGYNKKLAFEFGKWVDKLWK